MNERIKELAKQAGLEMCGCGCDMPTRQTNKFAELIVNECYNAVNEALYHDYVFDNHTPAEIRKTALRAVKGCFGIE